MDIRKRSREELIWPDGEPKLPCRHPNLTKNSLDGFTWAVAVGRRTKFAQKAANIAHTHVAKRTLPPTGTKMNVEYSTASATVMIIMQGL